MAGAGQFGLTPLHGTFTDSAQDANEFSRGGTTGDEWQLKVAALEQAPAVLAKKEVVVVGPDGQPRLVKTRSMGALEREGLVKAVLQGRQEVTDETQAILHAVRARFDRAGVPMADVVVRFKGLSVLAAVSVQQPRTLNATKHLWGLLERLRYRVSGTPGSRIKEIVLLRDVSSVLHPRRLTLLLGPPGSGKTTLMRALAGQLKGRRAPRVQAEELTYNGLSMNQFVVERTAAYVSQVDQHFGELTVRETLDFAALCQTSRTRKAAEVQLEEREKELGIVPDPVVAGYMAVLGKTGRENLATDIALKTLGLEGCADTLVGNSMLRGISGGQKKRVTTGEMYVGRSKVLFLDEISTGLDSATTLEICQRLRALCHTASATILVSLLQPSPETVNTFDDVMVLSQGSLVYHGPSDQVLPFFETLGFRCPADKGAADFLQEVTTPGEQQLYWAGEAPYRYVGEAEVAAAYRKTQHGAAFLQELQEAPELRKDGHGQLATHKYGQPQWTLFLANARRQGMLFWRNSAFIAIRILQCTFMGFAVGTLFLQESKQTLEDAQMFMSVLFFSTMTQVVVSFAAPGLLIERLPIYFKQRDAHFYPGYCFALPEILLQVPLIFTEAWIWTLMVYFMVGFVTSARLLAFWAMMFVCGLFGLSLFMLLAAVARKIPVANALQNLCIMIFTISSGFIINRNNLPKAWYGAYWANPVAYFVRGLVVNEFESSDWGGPSPEADTSLGEFYMTERGYQTGYHWVWIAMFGWGIGATILNCLLLSLACTYLSLPAARLVLKKEELEAWAEGSSRGAVPKVVSSISDASTGDSPTAQASPASRAPSPATAAPGAVEEGGVPAQPRKGSTLPFQPVTMTFQDIKYSVPLPKDSLSTTGDDSPHSRQLLLLKGISGCFRPGVLTALMGASGAGKSTLMDVLALRKTGGKITGDVRINGYPQRAETFNRVMGYVEQTDIHVPESTVHEALLFSARLRLPTSISSQAAKDYVEEVMEVVELGGLRHARVGLPGLSGLSVEQRKRLTIAVELVANPSIVFMDEPTSGLDARAAAVVMRAVRRISDLGRCVVCTIHQPSREIFQAFDELLLLKRGGEVIFSGPLGPGSANLIAYFEAIAGVPPYKRGQNPADYMLEVSSPAAEAERGINFARLYAASPLCGSIAQHVQASTAPAPGVEDLDLGELAPASMLTQTKELLRRNFQQYGRLTEYNTMRVIITLLIGILFGTVSDGQGDDTNNFNGVYNVIGVQYSSVMFLGILNAMCIQSIISLRRSVFYREQSAGTYSVLPYIIGEFLVELPCLILQGIAYSLLVYWMVGFDKLAGKFFWFLLIMILTLCNWTYFGIQSVHITPSLIIANAFTSFIFGVWDLFCGFYKVQTAIGSGWIWLYWINPISYTLYGLVVEEFGDVDRPLEGYEPPITVAQFVRHYWGYKTEFKGWIVLILCAFSGMWFATAFMALRFVKWQRR